jgi:hypothetical protein
MDPVVFSVLTSFAFLPLTLGTFLNGARNLGYFSDNCLIFCWHPHCVAIGWRLSSRRWSMTATTDSREMAVGSNEMVAETGAGPMEELATDGNGVENGPAHGTLPWIGALPNPRIGPMVVINDGGYLVPL